MPISSNCYIFNLYARYHTLTLTIPIFLIFKRNCLNQNSEATLNRYLKRVIFNLWSHMTCLGCISLIPKEKQPVPSTRGMDSTGWENGWLQLAMPGGNACTIRTVGGRMVGASPPFCPIASARLAERYLISTKSVAVMVLTPLTSSRVPTT